VARGYRRHCDFVPSAVVQDGHLKHVRERARLDRRGRLPGPAASGRELYGRHFGFCFGAGHVVRSAYKVLPLYCFFDVLTTAGGL
jgi:hypothetical protein